MRITALFAVLAAVAEVILIGQSQQTSQPAIAQPVEISSFSTSFHTGQQSRNHNIRLAAAILNGVEIPPGKTFSFNQTIGPRAGAAGFLRAPYLEFGERINVEGGGICLVSSVLYNAALLAGLEILERYPHSSTVPYLPPGQDATVDYGHKDLRVRNPYDSKILIKTEISGSRLMIRLFGNHASVDSIRLESINKTLPDGRLQVSTFRNVYLHGRLTQQNLLSEDFYPYPYPYPYPPPDGGRRQ